MSAVGETVVPAPAPEPVSTMPPVPEVVTEVDIPADGGFPAPEPEAPTEPVQVDAPKAEDEPKPVKKSPYQARIDTLTVQRTEATKRAEDAERQVALYRAMAEANGTGEPAAATVTAQEGLIPGTPKFQDAVQAEARRMADAQASKAKFDKVFSNGNADFKDFNDRCEIVASLGAGDRPDFMQIVTDPDVIQDGHKVIAQLADNPDEAARILALPTVQMTAALVKFQAEHGKPVARPLSAVTPPIKTIDGLSRGGDNEPKEGAPMAEYAAWYKKQQADKIKAGQPARFAKH